MPESGKPPDHLSGCYNTPAAWGTAPVGGFRITEIRIEYRPSGIRVVIKVGTTEITIDIPHEMSQDRLTPSKCSTLEAVASDVKDR